MISLLLLLVVLASGSVWGKDVYKWDFEDNEQSKDWQIINGDWIIENGVYKQKSNEKAAHILAGNSIGTTIQSKPSYAWTMVVSGRTWCFGL